MTRLTRKMTCDIALARRASEGELVLRTNQEETLNRAADVLATSRALGLICVVFLFGFLFFFFLLRLFGFVDDLDQRLAGR